MAGDLTVVRHPQHLDDPQQQSHAIIMLWAWEQNHGERVVLLWAPQGQDVIWRGWGLKYRPLLCWSPLAPQAAQDYS
ncbi:hypothetical protein Tco_1410883 [Tanacetum coccineum]|uniref:Uncharacterized protein n=1 Tax=Tanacetum coccineum TaxID=301880 RepID=A0ABQ4ZIR2_9ASTR